MQVNHSIDHPPPASDHGQRTEQSRHAPAMTLESTEPNRVAEQSQILIVIQSKGINCTCTAMSFTLWTVEIGFHSQEGNISKIQGDQGVYLNNKMTESPGACTVTVLIL